jgi:hypothetical protein
MRRISLYFSFMLVFAIALPQFADSQQLISSSTAEIQAELGAPTRIFEIPTLNQSIWTYRRATITFENGYAVAVKTHSTMRVSDLLVRATVGVIEPFTLGSTPEEVIQAQNRDPDRLSRFTQLNKELWWYRSAVITFEDGVVVGWNDMARDLNLAAPTIETELEAVSIGATEEEVLAQLGAPFAIKNISRLNENVWFYPNRNITFRDGVVYEWYGDRELDRTMDSKFSGLFDVDGDPSTPAIQEMIQNIDPIALQVMQGLFGIRGRADLRINIMEALEEFKREDIDIRGVFEEPLIPTDTRQRLNGDAPPELDEMESLENQSLENQSVDDQNIDDS